MKQRSTEAHLHFISKYDSFDNCSYVLESAALTAGACRRHQKRRERNFDN